MQKTQLVNDEKDKKIQRLEEELHSARSAIIRLMSDAKQRILYSFYECQTRQEAYAWLDRTANELIAMAEPLPREHSLYFSERAYCPLCGEGSSSPYESGYSLPEGLRRHLTGWGSNVKQCVVTNAASELAHDYWNSKFREAEQREETERAILQRRNLKSKAKVILWFPTRQSKNTL